MLAERAECQSCQLEVLASERDADDGDAKHDAEHQVREAYPNASEAYPEDVHDNAETCTRLRGGFHALAEGA